MFTSLALVHVPQADKWAYRVIPRSDARVRRVGVNFGAPGDRQAEGGSLWLSYPRRGGKFPGLNASVLPKKLQPFRRHASRIAGDGLTWVGASGVEGISSVTVSLGKAATAGQSYTLRLYFTEPHNHQPGQRVFDISLGRRKLLSRFDVVKEAGGPHRMVVKEFKKVTVAGALQLSFKASKGKPLLSGLEVIAE